MSSSKPSFLTLPKDIHSLLAAYLDLDTLQRLHICCKTIQIQPLYGLGAVRTLTPHPRQSAAGKFINFLVPWVRKGGKFHFIESYLNIPLPLRYQEDIFRSIEASSKLETVALRAPGPVEASPFLNIILSIKERVKHLKVPELSLLEIVKDETFPLLESLSIVSQSFTAEDAMTVHIPNAPHLRHLELSTTPLEKIPSLKHFSHLEQLCCFQSERLRHPLSKLDAAELVDQMKRILPESTHINVLFNTGKAKSLQRDSGPREGIVYCSLASLCVQGQSTLDVIDFIISRGYKLSKEPKQINGIRVLTSLSTMLGQAMSSAYLEQFLKEDRYKQIVFDDLPLAVISPEATREIIFSEPILQLSAARSGWNNLDPLAKYYSSQHICHCNLLTHVLDTSELPQPLTKDHVRILTEYDRAKALRISAKQCSPFFAENSCRLIYQREMLSYFFFDLRADPNLTDDDGRTVPEHLASITHQHELNAFVEIFKPSALVQRTPFVHPDLRYLTVLSILWGSERSVGAIAVLARGLFVDELVSGLVSTLSFGAQTNNKTTVALSQAILILKSATLWRPKDEAAWLRDQSPWRAVQLTSKEHQTLRASLDALLEKYE